MVLWSMCLALWAVPSGCKEQAPIPEESEPAAGQEQSGEEVQTRLADATLDAPQPSLVELIPDDDNDDAAAPACLPRSDGVEGWIKTRAVTVEPGGPYLERLADSEGAAQMRPYRIVEVAKCTYEKQAGGARLRLAVELLRCASPADAFGLCSAQRAGRAVGRTGRAWGEMSGEGYALHGWQSDCYLRAEARPASGPGLAVEAEQLVGRIMLALPQADPPALVRYLPSAGQVVGGQWFARSCHSLAGPGAGLVTPEQAGALDKILRLDQARGIAVAAYEAGGDEPPNYVWLVEYGTPGEARAAYGQYSNAVERSSRGDGSAPPVPPALLLSPVGRLLGGSWSPEQESEMHVLPACRSALSKLGAGSR